MKGRRPRFARQMQLTDKYRHRGMAKTNYRKLGKRVKFWKARKNETN